MKIRWIHIHLATVAFFAATLLAFGTAPPVKTGQPIKPEQKIDQKHEQKIDIKVDADSDGASKPDRPALEHADIQTATFPVWAAMELASQGKSSPGRFHTRLHREGWGYVLDAFQVAYDAGADTLLLHRPNGEPLHDGQNMNLDARVELLADPESRIILDGIPQFLDDFHARFPEARIVAYFGSSLEPDLIARLDAQQFSAFMDRYARSLQPWLNCPWVDIAFDHAGSFKSRDPHGAAILLVDAMLHSAGRTVYVEPQPRAWSVTADLPFIVQEYWWQRWADKTNTNGIRWLEGNSVITHGLFVNDYQAWVDACIKDGMGIAIGPWHFDELKLPITPRKHR